MRRALVFGGSGQLGAPVIDRLLHSGWQVVAVSRVPRVDREGLRWLRGDLQHVRGLPERADVVFSLGPLDHFSHWYAGSSMHAPRVVAFGSTSLETKQGSDDEQEREVAGRLRDAEVLVLRAASERGAAATLLRPTLVYGAGRDRTLTRIAALAGRSGFFVLPRASTGLRQPVHVADLADAAMAVVEAVESHGRSYALPGGETLAYAEMVQRVLAALQPPARLVRVPTTLFKAALALAHAAGRMQAIGQAAVARMDEDLVFESESARRDFGYAPRSFRPEAGMFAQ